jgi:hypothetical protein
MLTLLYAKGILMTSTLTAPREVVYEDTLDNEMEMLEVAQTLKGRLADMDNPDMWDDRPFEEYKIMINECSREIRRKYYAE